MRITTNTTYAVRCMVYLLNRRGETSSLRDVAGGTALPPNYLSKILRGLGRHGLIKSRKGRNGGYKLGRAPDSISLNDILLATSGGGSVLKMKCGAGAERCGFHKNCKVRGVWLDVGRIVGTYLSSCKLTRF